MVYRTYGKTGKKVSLLGFGGMRFSHDTKECHATVEKCYELGINYFDTAPNYCDDRSEDLMGDVFKHLDSNSFYISTKCGVWMDDSADKMLKRLEKSIARLHVPKIHFYNMWCIMEREQYEKIMAPGGPYQGALKAKELGLIDHICFTTHAEGGLVAEIIESGCFEGVTMGYNIVNYTYREKGLLAAKKLGLGVVTMNPLGGGLLAKNYFKFLQDSEFTQIQSALRFNMAHPEVTVVLSGMENPNEVEHNIKALRNLSQPSDEWVSAIKQRYNKLGERFCTNCKYCEPYCSVKIPISQYMRIRDSITLDGLSDEIKDRYIKRVSEGKFQGGTPDDCIECGACEQHCTQRIRIVEKLKECKADVLPLDKKQ